MKRVAGAVSFSQEFMMRFFPLLFALGLAVVLGCLMAASPSAAPEARKVTILYDAFGPASKLIKDWGYAALIEYGGKRILFDTGNNAATFEHNVKTLGIDLAKLDAVIISHRHGDHTSGLRYLLQENPDVTIYAPREAAFFKGKPPLTFLKPQPGLPDHLRYYEGKEPATWVTGTPWETAHFQIVAERTEIFPGLHVITTQSGKPGTMEMNELSLVIATPQGLAVVAGCAHPGIEKILDEAIQIEPRIYTVMGGIHLVQTEEGEVTRTARSLAEKYRVQRVAPGHCTSELGFAIFLQQFGDRFDPAGLGTVLPLP